MSNSVGVSATGSPSTVTVRPGIVEHDAADGHLRRQHLPAAKLQITPELRADARLTSMG